MQPFLHTLILIGPIFYLTFTTWRLEFFTEWDFF